MTHDRYTIDKHLGWVDCDWFFEKENRFDNNSLFD